jgi:hypothetical protein
MRATLTITFLLIICSKLLYTQDSLGLVNTYDISGKKHGPWIEFLDSNLKPTEEQNAKFWYYKIYCHGKKFSWVSNYCRKCELEYNKSDLDTMKVTLMNGKFKLIHPTQKGHVITYIIENGYVKFYRGQWDESGHYFEQWDYSKKYEEKKWSYYATGQTYKKKEWRGFVYYDERGKRKVEGRKHELTIENNN